MQVVPSGALGEDGLSEGFGKARGKYASWQICAREGKSAWATADEHDQTTPKAPARPQPSGLRALVVEAVRELVADHRTDLRWRTTLPGQKAHRLNTSRQPQKRAAMASTSTQFSRVFYAVQLLNTQC